ncbi:VOC family protein [Bacteroides gallinaceum]|uniref:VOC family protein n=1 Tax=Bacteroides gallinaceum TaxID=1462571 RepID=UPI00195B6282|nr:VOC family protein [Bacteroides gallinaceum]MBM6658177.1 VOC family protein [Bacteroides gallinaceum]
MLNEILFHHVGYVVADIRLSAAQFAQLGYVAGEILYDEGLQVELCYLTKEGAPLVELVHQLQSGSLEANLLHANGVMPYHLAYEALGFDKACEELLAQGYERLFAPVQVGALQGIRICYFHHPDAGYIELIEKR